MCGNHSGETNYKCCQKYGCNGGPGLDVHKDVVEMDVKKAAMRSIMYTILGMIFGVVWLISAILMPTFPSGWLQLIYGIIVAFFGLFLVLIPQTTYLGLYFVALGAFFVYISHHDGKYHDNTAGAFGCAVGFLIISGLTFVSFGTGDWVTLTTPSQCFTDLGYDIDPYGENLYGYPTRCENYLLYVLFCIYMLLLLMPFGIMLAWYATRAAAVVPATNANTNVVSVPAEVNK